MRSLRDTALLAARNGYFVFRTKPRSKFPMPRSSGYLDATRDELVIEAWWLHDPACNVAIACGASQMFALDFDSKAGCDPKEAIDELDLHGFPTVWTGEAGPPDEQHPHSLEGVRGAQTWFAMPEVEIRNGKTTIAGVETRGAGGYVMCPGSIHPSAVMYEGTVGPAHKLPAAPSMCWS
jgi:hypothetical protein